MDDQDYSADSDDGVLSDMDELSDPDAPSEPVPAAVPLKAPAGTEIDAFESEMGSLVPEVAAAKTAEAHTTATTLAPAVPAAAADEARQALLRLASSSAPERLSGAEALCRLLSELELDPSADAGAHLCAALRAGGGVELLCRLLCDAEQLEPVLRQRALFALGNMCSHEVDAAASETREQLLRYIFREPLRRVRVCGSCGGAAA